MPAPTNTDRLLEEFGGDLEAAYVEVKSELATARRLLRELSQSQDPMVSLTVIRVLKREKFCVLC
jgi:Trm5-related predicted tRNA methylase